MSRSDAGISSGPDYGLLMVFARLLTILGLLMVAVSIITAVRVIGAVLDISQDVSPITAFSWPLGLFLSGSSSVVIGQAALALRDLAINSWHQASKAASPPTKAQGESS